MLEVRNLVKRYGAATALAGVSFSIDPGICAIVGPNGAGKTTLLRTVTGAERADSGTVTLDGMDVYANAPRIFRHIGYLSDQVPLYRDLTVEDHLLYRGRLKGLVPRRLRARVRHVTELLDLKPVFSKQTSSLSAGQRKRVGIADAMLTDVRVLAIDEPFEGLDADHCEMLAAAFASAARHTLVLLATHRFDVLEKAGGTCLVLASGALAASFAFGGRAGDSASFAGPGAPSGGGGAAPSAPLAARIADALRAHYASGLEVQP